MLNLEKPVDRHGRSWTIRDNLDDPDEMKIPMHRQLIWLYLKILKISWKFYSMRKYLQILYERLNKILVLFKIEWCLNGCPIKELQTEGSRDSIFCRIWTLSSKIAILTMVTRTGPDYALDRIFGSEFSSPIFSVHGPFFLVRIIILWPGSLTGPKKIGPKTMVHSAYSKI